MIKVLIIIDNLHHKNKQGLNLIIDYIEHHYKDKFQISYGNVSDIENYDIIYSSCNPITLLDYPTKKFIFGPHFSVFPDNKINILLNQSNYIYIQPSMQAVLAWKRYNLPLNLECFPFPVNTNKFKPLGNTRTNFFIYYKRRHPTELQILLDYITSKTQDTFRIFDYCKGYNEDDYLAYIQTCKYGIILDAHESQGFAIQEALSCNIPLLVWSTQTMSQEWNGNSYTYTNNEGNIPSITIPYWNAQCGEFFYNYNNLDTTYNKFIRNLQTYTPREYILENLSSSICTIRFIALCNQLLIT